MHTHPENFISTKLSESLDMKLESVSLFYQFMRINKN